MSEQAGKTSGLQAIGFPQTGRLHWNLSEPELYEEAVARQWSATRDIPWAELPELPSDIELAMCQV